MRPNPSAAHTPPFSAGRGLAPILTSLWRGEQHDAATFFVSQAPARCQIGSAKRDCGGIITAQVQSLSSVTLSASRGTCLAIGSRLREIPYNDDLRLWMRMSSRPLCREPLPKGDGWMGAKQLTYSDEARQKPLSGVSKLARAVRATLGPRGRNAVIDKGWGSPNVTKDGVTVAEEIELQDPYENMGAQLVKEAASKTSDVAGDGTTTATILAEAIYREGLKSIASGADPMALTRGIHT